MRRQDQFRCGLLVAFLLTAPAVAHAEPIVRLTQGFFNLHFSDELPLTLDASGPNGSVFVRGDWTFTSNIAVGERLLTPRFLALRTAPTKLDWATGFCMGCSTRVRQLL